MIPLSHFLIPVSLLFACLSSIQAYDESSDRTIYDVLKSYGLPTGLFPKGVKNFTLESSGEFVVHLDRACNSKFENELHYDADVSGFLSYGKIIALSGITVKDLFLWFQVIEIRVDVPSSGLIHFEVGVVSKQFSLSSFETPRDCLAVNLRGGTKSMGYKILPYGLGRGSVARTT